MPTKAEPDRLPATGGPRMMAVMHAPNTIVPSPRRPALAAAAGLALLLPACDTADDAPRAAATQAHGSPGISIDGSFADWPAGGTTATADGAFVYLKLALHEDFTLQGGRYTTTLELDLDAKDGTGRRTRSDRLTGADLEVVFSPPSPERGRGLQAGITVHALDDLGTATEVRHAAVGLAFAPTFASREVELRIARGATLPEPAGSRFRAAARLRGQLLVEDVSGRRVAASEVFTADLPPRRDAAPIGGEVPPAPDGALRVLSWNVEWESPVNNPPPFARLLSRLMPDVLLIQEWKSTPQELAAWFSAHVPSPTPWRAHTLGDLGVCVVARHPLVPLQREPLMPAREVAGRKAHPVRYVSARVETPLGVLLAASLHLKCCGSKDTWEDELRQVEAQAVNDHLRGLLAREPDAACVLSGDLNLVGTHLPLEQLRADLDADGSDLDVVQAAVHGDAVAYTWNDADARFSPGRLDYAVISDARLAAARAFIVDTACMTDAALEACGWQRADSLASDHRPLVIDLVKPTPPGAESAGLGIEPIEGAELATQVRGAGAPVVVNFWATTCIPCIQELPDLLRAWREARNQGVRLVLVSCDGLDAKDKALELLQRLGVDFPTWIKLGKDEPFIDAVDSEWSGTLPATLVYDASGKRLLLHEGKATYEEFHGWIRQALQADRPGR